MSDAIDTFLALLGNEDEVTATEDSVLIETEDTNNEFITASKLLVKREKVNETDCEGPIGPDIVDLFGEFDEDDTWLNEVDIEGPKEKRAPVVAEDEPVAKGFSIGSSVGQAKTTSKKSKDDEPEISEKKPKNAGSVVTFGNVRIKDLLFEPHEIERRTKSATLITLSQIPWKIRTNVNKEVDFDWITFGVIVSKELKTSTKNGSSYTLMKLSDLVDVSKHVSLFLFGESHANHWKLQPSSVIGLLNSKIMPNQDNKKRGDEICSLTLNQPGHLVHVGTSVDLGHCKSVKKNGDICNAVINKKDCTTCIYHVQSEYKKMSSRRPELKLSYSGITPKSGNSSFKFSTDSNERDQEMNGNHIPLIGPATTSSFNHAVKRALTDPSLDASTSVKSRSEAGASGASSANGSKKPRLDGSSDFKKSPEKKTVRMTDEEWKAEKKRRQELIDSYELRRKMEAEMIRDALKKPLTLAARNLKAAIAGTSDLEAEEKKGIDYFKTKIQSSKGQRISLTGAQNPAEIFKHLRPVEVTRAPVPMLGRGLKPGQDITMDLRKNREFKTRNTSSMNFSAEDARKLRHNMAMMQRKAAAAKILAKPVDPEDLKKKKIEELMKRVQQNLESEEESKETKLARIEEALHRKSKHVNEVKEVESKDEAAYFSRLEKKEALEEKMAATTTMKVKGVVCATCKYIAESQGEYCLKNGHQVLRKEVTKRFLACKSCNHRLVAYNAFIPNRCCPKCKGTEFKNSSLRPSKVIEKLEPLLIRGEECKFLNSND